MKRVLPGIWEDSVSCWRKPESDTQTLLLTCNPVVTDGTYCLVPSTDTGPHRRDSWSSLSWLRELSAPTEVAPAGSWLSWSITSRPLSSAIWWIRSSTCSWGVVSVIAELMESSITWCRTERDGSRGDRTKKTLTKHTKHLTETLYENTYTIQEQMHIVCSHSLRCGRRGSGLGFQTYPWPQRPFGDPWSSELYPEPWSPGPCFW